MKTHIHIILDKSGSMLLRRQATIDSFNSYLNELKTDENLKDSKISMVLFDTEFNDVHIDDSIDNIKLLTEETYIPGGATALYDAIGRTLNLIKKKRKGRHLVIIITDGEENSSTEFTQEKVFDTVSKLEKWGNWTFVYMGCNQDSYLEGAKFGAVKGNIIDYDPNAMPEAFSRLSKATRNYAGGQSLGISRFWDGDKF